MIKVLMITPFVNLNVNAGNTIHQTNIVKNLSKKIWLEWIVQGSFKKENVRIIRVKREKYGILSGIRLLKDCFKKINENYETCDIIHDRGDLFCVGTLHKLIKKHKKPVILQIDGDWVEAFVRSRNFFTIFKPFLKLWVKKMFQTADVLVPVSRTLAEKIEKEYKINKNKIIVNPNGVDIKLFSKIKSRSFNKKNPEILFMGAMGAWYDINTILEAMKLLKKDGVSVSCTLILSGLDFWPELYENLKEFIKKNKLDVRIKKEVLHEKVPLELSKADILIAPYFRQAYGFSPLKIFEYMAVKKPIISNNLPEIKEVLKNEENALLVSCENAEEMKEAIKRIINEKKLRKKISENAYKTVAKNYSWKKHAKTYENIYEMLKTKFSKSS